MTILNDLTRPYYEHEPHPWQDWRWWYDRGTELEGRLEDRVRAAPHAFIVTLSPPDRARAGLARAAYGALKTGWGDRWVGLRVAPPPGTVPSTQMRINSYSAKAYVENAGQYLTGSVVQGAMQPVDWTRNPGFVRFLETVPRFSQIAKGTPTTDFYYSGCTLAGVKSPQGHIMLANNARIDQLYAQWQKWRRGQGGRPADYRSPGGAAHDVPQVTADATARHERLMSQLALADHLHSRAARAAALLDYRSTYSTSGGVENVRTSGRKSVELQTRKSATPDRKAAHHQPDWHASRAAYEAWARSQRLRDARRATHGVTASAPNYTYGTTSSYSGATKTSTTKASKSPNAAYLAYMAQKHKALG